MWNKRFITDCVIAWNVNGKTHDTISIIVSRCSACDSLFSSLMALEHHKEEFEHWSGDEDSCTDTDDDDGDDDMIVSEECERLL